MKRACKGCSNIQVALSATLNNVAKAAHLESVAAADNDTKRGNKQGSKIGKNMTSDEKTLECLKLAILDLKKVGLGGELVLRSAALKHGLSRCTLHNYSRPVRDRKELGASDDVLRMIIDQIKWKPQGNPTVIATKVFTVDEDTFIHRTIVEFCEGGFPLNVPSLCAMAADAARRLGLVSPKSREAYKLGKGWARGFLKKFPDLRKYKSSSIDVLRCQAATSERRDALFKLLDVVLKRAKAENPGSTANWDLWADIPSVFKYNMDEEAKDSTKGRSVVLGSVMMMLSKFSRIFQQGDGDGRPIWHFTNVATSRADGRMVIPPMLIGSRPGSENPIVTLLDLMHIAWKDPTTGEHLWPTGIEVAVTPSGSMLRKTFPLWCKHFVSNLPKDQGKGQMPVFLFLDGHASRWTYKGLKFLKDNNVYVICLPSHTSIFSQPNDAGLNAAFKWLFGQVVTEWRTTHMANIYGPMTRQDFNLCFVATWTRFVVEQHEKLARTGVNAITSAWNNVGLVKGDPKCVFWERAIATIGRTAETANKAREKREADLYKELQAESARIEARARPRRARPRRSSARSRRAAARPRWVAARPRRAAARRAAPRRPAARWPRPVASRPVAPRRRASPR
jgi:hypothetical protein